MSERPRFCSDPNTRSLTRVLVGDVLTELIFKFSFAQRLHVYNSIHQKAYLTILTLIKSMQAKIPQDNADAENMLAIMKYLRLFTPFLRLVIGLSILESRKEFKCKS